MNKTTDKDGMDRDYDTLQEQGQWAVDNDQIVGKLEDHILKLNIAPDGKPESDYIRNVLGPLEKLKAEYLAKGQELIAEAEKLKVSYEL